MAYNNNEPANDSFIRDFPNLTRDNFQAIQSGDSTFAIDQLNFDVQGGAPATGALSNKIILYSNDDSNGVASFFAYNESGNAIQITEGDYFGGVGQKFALQSLSFDTSDSKYTLDGNFICHAYGAFNAGGTKDGLSKNIASVSYSGGSQRYTIVTEAIYGNASAICLVTPTARGKTIAPEIVSLTESGGAITVVIQMWNASGSSSSEKDTSGAHFAIFGGM